MEFYGGLAIGILLSCLGWALYLKQKKNEFESLKSSYETLKKAFYDAKVSVKDYSEKKKGSSCC